MNRRTLLRGPGTAPLFIKPALVRSSQRNSAVRLALYGCGGRGTGVAESFIANTSAHLTAQGDLFPDPLARAKDRLDTASAKAGKMKYDAPVRITGRRPWDAPGIGIAGQTAGPAAATGAFKGAIEDADAMKERHWIDSIVSGKFINEAAQGAESGLSAILGRTVTWDEVANSNEAWDARLDVQKM
ncbi:MAG: hypothetical protein HXY18_02630 [Bryobacteraceae bacterium]|nr:hypothetical protein [Bryobacteraceae bacterium]